MNKNMRKSGWVLLIAITVIQFIPINRINPEGDESADFFAKTQASEEVISIMKNACMDCHSHQTAYPWYTYVAPVSWWIVDHIEEGRSHLNFSVWSTYDEKRKDHKLEEVVEVMEEHEMPLSSYTWMHSEAKLTEEQRQLITDWAKKARAEKLY